MMLMVLTFPHSVGRNDYRFYDVKCIFYPLA